MFSFILRWHVYDIVWVCYLDVSERGGWHQHALLWSSYHRSIALTAVTIEITLGFCVLWLNFHGFPFSSIFHGFPPWLNAICSPRQGPLGPQTGGWTPEILQILLMEKVSLSRLQELSTTVLCVPWLPEWKKKCGNFNVSYGILLFVMGHILLRVKSMRIYKLSTISMANCSEYQRYHGTSDQKWPSMVPLSGCRPAPTKSANPPTWSVHEPPAGIIDHQGTRH